MNPITVITNPNIALIKYWGKRDEILHLPTKSSLSVAIDAFTTQTSVDISPIPCDQIIINSGPAPAKISQPVLDFLTLFKNKYGMRESLAITTTNNFPTAAGLASSASGFAALTLALNKFFNLQLPQNELSILARQGSGSACRSLFGGFVLWHQGQNSDGHDSIAEQLFTAEHWPNLRIIIAIASTTAKPISSRIAMQQTVKTSPIYNQWLEESATRLALMQNALKHKDFNVVGQLAEEDCLDMHKTMHTSNPPTNFWSSTTYTIMQAVTDLRNKHAIPCYFTIDAGPNVKILCLDNNVSSILDNLEKITGVNYCITSKIGAGPQLIQ